MSSPAHLISSADDESRELAELKAKHEAELREAAERKARRDQERRERRKREKREKKEWEEREAREITHRIWEVGKAVAEVARAIAETEQEQQEREQEALLRMRMVERPTETEVEAREIAETTCKLQEVFNAVAERARDWVEAQAWVETEKLWAALDRVQEGLEREGWSDGSEGEAQGPTTAGNQTEGAPLPTRKPHQRQVVTSHPNTAEVVIVRPST